MRKNNLSIHSENILPIIKKWLYSSREIFLRELISNSCDAIKKHRILTECKEAQADESPYEVHVRIDTKNKTVTISDNGIGMSEEEVEKYIAQIAFSGAEEFVSKYQKQSESDPIIGHFGLGFYSSYMVASKVELLSKSYKEDAQAVRWICDGSSSYEIGSAEKEFRGTEVILHLNEESEEFLQEAKVRELLDRYCSFMPDPVFLNGKPLNNQEPLWMKSPSSCTEKEYVDFYRKLYPLDQDPIFWIHLNVDYPFRLQGILYFPKTANHLESKQSAIKLFCNRVYVSEDCAEILPDYLMILRGAIDSPDIPLNVSRSYLQVDQKVRQLGAHIAKKVADRLSSLFKNNRKEYVEQFPEFELLLKLGFLQDEKFAERVKEIMIWKSSTGEWTTAQEYLDRAKEKKIYYCAEDCSTAIQKAYLDQGIELLYAAKSINSPVMSSLEHSLKIEFQRIDSALNEALIDKTRENTLLDADGKSPATRIADFFRNYLPKELQVEAKSLAADQVAGMIVLDEQTRRMRDFFQLTQRAAEPSFSKNQTLVLNTNNPLIQSAWKLSEKKPDLAGRIASQVYDLARLAQKEIDPSEFETVLSRQQSLLEELATSLS